MIDEVKMLLDLLQHSRELLLEIFERLWPQNMRAIGRLMIVCKQLRDFIIRNQCLNAIVNHCKQQMNICKDINGMNLHYSVTILGLKQRTIRDFKGKLTIYDFYGIDNAFISYTFMEKHYKHIYIRMKYKSFIIAIDCNSFHHHRNYSVPVDYIPSWLKLYHNKVIGIRRNNEYHRFIYITVSDTTKMEKLESVSKEEFKNIDEKKDYEKLYWTGDGQGIANFSQVIGHRRCPQYKFE